MSYNLKGGCIWVAGHRGTVGYKVLLPFDITKPDGRPYKLTGISRLQTTLCWNDARPFEDRIRLADHAFPKKYYPASPLVENAA